MIDPIVGTLISAGAKLIPELIGKGSDKAEAQWNANFELQQRMAEHGTLIRARDVMAAYKETGIHPLSLMGMNPAAASSVAAVGGTESNWRKGVADAGQDIGRAIGATAGAGERQALQKLLIERGGLENDLLRLQIANQVQQLSRNAQIGPAMPISPVNRYLIPGQGETHSGNLIKEKALERTKVNPDATSYEPGAVPGIGVVRMPDGSLMPVKSKDAQERLEDDIPGNIKHFLLRTFGPMIDPKGFAPGKAPPGYRWYVDWKGDYHLKPLSQRLKGRGWRD